MNTYNERRKGGKEEKSNMMIKPAKARRRMKLKELQ